MCSIIGNQRDSTFQRLGHVAPKPEVFWQGVADLAKTYSMVKDNLRTFIVRRRRLGR